MKWNPEDDRILVEIERWEDQRFRTGKAAMIVGFFFSPIDSAIDRILPQKLLSKAIGPMKKTLKSLQDTSTNFVNIDALLDKTSDSGIEVDSLLEMKELPTPYLDELAQSYFSRNQIVTTLQGAGFATAGFALALLDIPLIFMHNMKMVLQIGACYGYDPDLKSERDFAYKIFCLVASEREKDRQLAIDDINAAISSMVKRNLIGSELRGMAAKEISELAITKIIQWYARRKLSSGIPIVGIVISGGFNYLFTKEMATYAYMLYRKRFIQDKLALGLEASEIANTAPIKRKRKKRMVQV
ncbi:MAG: hypothetical protein ACI9CF_000929 [Candidatus Omnitrophota bacterium]